MVNMDRSIPCLHVLDTRVDAVQIPEIIRYMDDCIAKKSGCEYIVVANVDTVVKSKSDGVFKKAVDESGLSIPDGFPLLLMGRLKGYQLKKRAYGPDLMFEFLKSSESKGYSHFFYGATDDTLTRLIKNIKMLFPGIRIAGSYAPPFRPLTGEEDAGIVEMIKGAAPDVLWVGIGCPKQELWMREHKEMLNVPVMVGVGAAFDFLSGVKPQAPVWMRDNGLEWLFRLAGEPKRLWRRYLIGNSLFIYYVLEEAVAKTFFVRRKRKRGGDAE